MDIVSAALSLYLLFPILTDRQQRYSELIKKNLTSSPAEVEKRLELLKFLGFDESGFELDIPEEDEEGMDFFEIAEGANEEGDAETTQEEPKENIAEIYLRNTNSHLKLFEHGEEKLSVGDKEGKRSSVVSVNQDVVTRTKYDSEYRMIEQITWKNKSSLSESMMLTRRNWFYRDDSTYMTEEDFENNIFTDTVFNMKDLPVKVMEHKVEDVKTDGDEKVQKKNLARILLYEYDDENRVIVDREEVYEQKKNESTGRVKDVVIFSQEKKYTYTENSETPDLKYYEDGFLRIETQQISDDVYYESLYFPGGSGVRTKYENGLKVDEKMFLYKEGQ
ncbi:MAG: hypothetical protein KBS64_01875 [Treponema sp.]|nr:hypothetical protein [Candidatus Treponema equi]